MLHRMRVATECLHLALRRGIQRTSLRTVEVLGALQAMVNEVRVDGLKHQKESAALDHFA